MGADELVWKVKGKKSSYKIRSGMRGGRIPHSTEMNVNIANYKDVALFFHDLKFIWGAPVDKAIEEYKRPKQKGEWIFD